MFKMQEIAKMQGGSSAMTAICYCFFFFLNWGFLGGSGGKEST